MTIFEALAKKQTFGMIKKCFCSLFDADNKMLKFCRYQLTDNYSADTAVTASLLKPWTKRLAI